MLRENGRVETYSDFMLTDETTVEESQIIDIETDFEYFYIKSLKDAVQEEDDAALIEKKNEQFEFEMRKIKHSWRNRVGYNTSQPVKNIDKWFLILHKRISRYFKIYTQVLNFSMYMIIAHRTILSIYDMSKACFKEEHFAFKNFIRFMALKKNSKKARMKQEKKAEDRFD